MTNIVLMDRDLTVDVNFEWEPGNPIPKDAKPVPLSWVTWMAHEAEDIHVWATGNQHLKQEAQIPGIAEARDVWESTFYRSAKREYPSNGYYNYKPARHEGWRLIKDIYEEKFIEDDFNFIVVDDTHPFAPKIEDEGFDLWLPWDFREAVDNGEGPIELPDQLLVPALPLQRSDVDYETEDDLHEIYMEELE